MGIAVKTFLDDLSADEKPEERAERKKDFPTKFLPFATHFTEDLDIAYAFFDALAEGVKSLDNEISASDKAAWEKASKYLESRR